MLRKSAKSIKYGCTKWRKKSEKGFPFSIPIKIKMTSSNEGERWNELFSQLHALVHSVKNRRTEDENQTPYLHQHLGDLITTQHYLVNAYHLLDDDLTTIKELIRNLRIMYVEFFGDKMKTNNRLAYLNLDCDNGFHMFLLHYVYTPRINNAIESFCVSWNHHPLEPLLVQV